MIWPCLNKFYSLTLVLNQFLNTLLSKHLKTIQYHSSKKWVCKNNQEFLGCNIIQKKTEENVKPYSAIGLDSALAVSVPNFPLSSIEELFEKGIMGISRHGTSWDDGIFKNSRYPSYSKGEENWYIKGATGWDGNTIRVFRGDYNDEGYLITLYYNSQMEINYKVKLVVEKGKGVVPLKLKYEIDELILKFIKDHPDIDYQA